MRMKSGLCLAKDMLNARKITQDRLLAGKQNRPAKSCAPGIAQLSSSGQAGRNSGQCIKKLFLSLRIRRGRSRI